MNFAFSALLILFLALPGVIFWYSYRLTTGIPIASRPLMDEVPIGMALSALLHCAWIALTNFIGSFMGLQVNLGAAVILLAGQGGRDGKFFHDAEQSFSAHFWCVVVYFVSICAFAGPLGRLFRYVTAGTWIARNLPPYRGNDWFYLLRGESPNMNQQEDDPAIAGETLFGILVAAVMGDHLYKGYLVDYVFGKSGDLDAIVLSGAARRKLGEGEVPNGEPHFPDEEDGNHPAYFMINAEHLILKYSETSNLSVTRIWALPEAADPAAAIDGPGGTTRELKIEAIRSAFLVALGFAAVLAVIGAFISARHAYQHESVAPAATK